MLKFSFSNSKMHKLAQYLGLKRNEVAALDLPAGYTCPMASICQSFADRNTGKITDGKDCKFRCYAASAEAAFSSARRLRWHNFDTLRSAVSMLDEIMRSIPDGLRVLRVHSSGDFFNFKYFNAWLGTAIFHPEIQFFAYTKVLPYVTDCNLPSNFHMEYSYGGKMDNELKNEPTAYVVSGIQEANLLSLPVACVSHPADDYDFILQGKSFALPLHGTQPKGKAKSYLTIA